MDSPDDDQSQDPGLVEWAAEIADRIQAGESIDLEKVTRGHPERATMMRRLLPAIEMMAALGAERNADVDNGLIRQRDPDDGPEVLGDFELVRELGRGGMGIVYEARQLSLGRRRVAVKILSAAAALDPRQMRRFQVEIQAAACLDHEHVVPVYSVGHERGVPFYVMRLIDGRSLAQIIRELRRDEGHETADGEFDDRNEPDAMATKLANELVSERLVPDPADVGQRKSIAGDANQALPAAGAASIFGKPPLLKTPRRQARRRARRRTTAPTSARSLGSRFRRPRRSITPTERGFFIGTSSPLISSLTFADISGSPTSASPGCAGIAS